MGFRENLKEEMDYQGLTTQRLSDLSGVNKRTIDHYLMNNPQEPSVSNAVKIARALKVSAEYLVTGTSPALNRPSSRDINELVNGYCALTPDVQQKIRDLVKAMASG